MDKLLVHNSRRFSEYVGIRVESGEDILINSKCEDFIEKYKKYFLKPDKDLMEKFFLETGLILGFIYDCGIGSISKIKCVSFNSLCCSLRNPFSKDIYDNHLTVVNKVKNIFVKDDKLYVDGIDLYDLRNDDDVWFSEYKNKIVRNHLNSKYIQNPFDGLQSQVEIIKKEYDSNYDYDENDIKQITISSLGKLFVLKKDGTLLRNNQVYDKDVLAMWNKDSFTTMIIFKDNRIEFIESRYEPYDRKYDKVIYDDLFIATLKNKNLAVTRIGEEPDSSINVGLCDIDDFLYDSDKEILKIFKNNEYIELDIESIYCEVN